jgi:hypothetical protein
MAMFPKEQQVVLVSQMLLVLMMVFGNLVENTKQVHLLLMLFVGLDITCSELLQVGLMVLLIHRLVLI